MPRISVMFDGVVIKEVELTKERTSLGRRPHNDVVIENLTVSGEHAVLIKSGEQVTVEDLGSTNGTFVAGKAVKKQLLQHGDVLELGKYKITFEAPETADEFEKTMVFKPRTATPAQPAAPQPAPVAPAPTELHGFIKVMTGPATGREMALTKVVTNVGKLGVAVASIIQRRTGFLVQHVEGTDRTTLNGQTLGDDPAPLNHGDEIVLAGIQMQFLQR